MAVLLSSDFCLFIHYLTEIVQNKPFFAFFLIFVVQLCKLFTPSLWHLFKEHLLLSEM